MPKLPKPRTIDLPAKVLKQLRALELGKKHYKRADKLLSEIRREAAALPEKYVQLPGKKKAFIVDKFLEKDVVFQPVGARRYEIIVEDDE